jgi:putative transcriptional regulator
MRLRDVLPVACGLLMSASPLLAQSKKVEDLAAGKLLVVPREAPDPAFAEDVILLVRYERGGGALGLVVNHPTKIPLSRALKDVKGAAKSPDMIWFGGPVEVEAVMALVRSKSPPRDALLVFGDLFMISSKKDLEGALKAGGNGAPRVYAGYCGWSSGQLEREIRLGGWYIFDRNEAAIFDAKPETLWERLIAKTEFRIARFDFVRSLTVAFR